MHDILLFGCGYNGDKRDIEGLKDSIMYPAKPVVFSIQPGQSVSIRPQYSGFYDFQIHKIVYRDKSYLIATNGDAPSAHVIEHAILSERPNPID